MNQGKKLSKRAGAGLGAALMVLAGSLFLLSGINRRQDFTSGLAYLEAQKKKEQAPILASLNEMRANELKEQVASGQISIFNMFQDYVLLGDSRALGFAEYDFLASENVKANLGDTIEDIQEHLLEIAARKPHNIIISYGINDMSSDLGQSPGGPDYGQLFEAQIRKILEVDPGAAIYVNSVLPIQQEAQTPQTTQERVDQYNASIQEMCQRNGWNYIDNNKLFEGVGSALYEEDGIHFAPAFYPLWGTNIIDVMNPARRGNNV